MIKLKQWLLLGCGLLVGQFLHGQTTVNFTADSTVIDAMVGSGGVANQNYGGQPQMRAYYQSGTIPTVFRTFMHYDLSSIPENALITSATLTLVPQLVDNTANHPIYIERVQDNLWYESSITWNNQPGVITTDQLAFTHAQTTNTSSQSFDVTSHVQKMVNYPDLNHGWRIRLQNESASVNFGLSYYSTEATTSSTRPVLTVQYIMPIELEPTVEHCTAGNSDGNLSVALTGGSTYGLSNIYFYKTVRDTTQPGNASLVSVKTTYNVQYNSGTGIMTAENLDPGIYIVRVYDNAYYTASNSNFTFYKHVLVGREGEVTTGVLVPNSQFQENTTIARDKPTNTAPIDRANTNYNTNASVMALRVNDAPNIYENASLIRYELDFDDQLQFSTAELHMRDWSGFYRHNNSSNAVNYTLATSPWDEDVVTWNTRPTINNSYQLYVPTTTYIGYDPVHNRDTLSLLSFVEYWQENPTENYGFEIALETYGATQAAFRDYRGAGGNSNYLILEFSVRNPVYASFDDETNTGTVVVNAPKSGTLPYTYLISTEPIGTQLSVWDEIKTLGVIDSTSFFDGMVDTISYVYNNLPSGQYYFTVFDHTGAKIMSDSTIVNTAIGIYDDTDLDLSQSNQLTRSSGATGAGTGRLYAELLEDEPFGGVSFTLDALGSFYLGFNKTSQTTASAVTDFEFGLKVDASGNYQVIKDNATITGGGSVSAGSLIDIYRDYDDYVIRIDGSDVYRGGIANLTGENASFDIVFNDGTAVVTLKYYPGKLKKPGTKAKITYPECGEYTGDIVMLAGVGVSVIYSTLVNNHDATSISATLVGGSYTFSDVPIGTYTLNTAYSVAPMGGYPGYSYVTHEQLAMGYVVQWEDKDHTEEISYGPSNFAIRPEPSYMGIASANSTNRTILGGDNWVQYETQVGTMTSPGFQGIFLRKDSEYALGLGVISLLGAATICLGEPIDDCEYSGFARNGIWRFEQNEDEFSIFNYNVPVEGFTGEDGVYDINIIQVQNAQYINTIASFCSNYPIPDQFVEPKREIEGGYFLVPLDDLLRFEFNEEYDLSGNLNYVVRDFTGQPLAGLDTFTEVYGDNRYMLDVSSLSSGVYIMEIINDKGENWFIRFKVQA